MDKDLSPEDKFELYYDEHEKDKKKKEKPQSLDKILNKLGLRKSSGGSDTH